MRKPPHKDPYQPYYEGNSMGQQSPSPSMSKLSRFFKKNGVQKVLDFYCGMGRNSILLSGEGFDVDGFDKSGLAISKASENQREAKTKVSFESFNYLGKLPYRSGYFDAVIAVRALYQANVREIKRDIKEINRVTRVGGYLYLESDQQIIWKARKSYGQTETSERGTYVHDNGDSYHYFNKKELRTFFDDYKTVRFYFKNRKFYVLYQKT